MQNLIDKLLAMDHPSRNVDVAIYKAVFNEFAEPFKQYQGMAWVSHDKGANIPQFTSSIDAALTLVPAGWEWLISNRAPAPSSCTCLHQ